MGLDIAELVMDVEEHLGVEVRPGDLPSPSSPVIGDLSLRLGRAAREQGVIVSDDYLTGFIIGLIYRAEVSIHVEDLVQTPT